MDHNSVVIKPLLTEKTNSARVINKYYFQVHPKANKVMVKKALELLFKVKIRKCNIFNVKGKKKRSRFGVSFLPNKKKAVVTLKKGENFSFYEGV